MSNLVERLAKTCYCRDIYLPDGCLPCQAITEIERLELIAEAYKLEVKKCEAKDQDNQRLRGALDYLCESVNRGVYPNAYHAQQARKIAKGESDE